MQEGERMCNPQGCERTYTDEEFAFLFAVDTYKRVNKRPHPTWSEVLAVAKSLGYRKVAEQQRLPTYGKVLPQDNKDQGGAEP